MSKQHTRRDFLKFSSATVVAGAATGALAIPASATSRGYDSGNISVWVTDDKRRFESTPPLERNTASRHPEGTITIDSDKKSQKVLGFGAAFTDASCYIFSQLPPEQRAKLFHELFHPSELGLSVCRTCIGASDYSTEVYSFDEG